MKEPEQLYIGQNGEAENLTHSINWGRVDDDFEGFDRVIGYRLIGECVHRVIHNQVQSKIKGRRINTAHTACGVIRTHIVDQEYCSCGDLIKVES